MSKNVYEYERIPHIMKVSKTMECPSNLLFFDTETMGEIDKVDMHCVRHKFFMGYVYATRFEKLKETRIKEAVVQSIPAFWSFVKKRIDKLRPLYCFSHNLPFDLTILDFWLWSERENIPITFAVMEDPPTIIMIEIDKCKIYFIDTLNYWRLPLAKIGKSVGLEKLEMPGEVKNSKAFVEYCKNDVMILKKAVTQLIAFLIENDLGSFGFSTPSIAMHTFKHSFLKPNTLFIHDNKRALKLERECYYGGYVGNFYVGKVKSKVYYLDVNSLYPFVMQNPVPTKLLQVKTAPRISELRRCIKSLGMVAQVEIKSIKESFPKRLDGKLCMVRGHYMTTLCGPELIRAIEKDCIVDCPIVALYEMKCLFKEYVQYFYNLRQKFKASGNETYDQFCKLMMNSLYGKFGQLGFRWKILNEETLRLYYDQLGLPYPKEYEQSFEVPSINWFENKWFALGLDKPIQVRSINGQTQIKFPIGEHAESSPIISAYITSYGRELLRKFINIAGRGNTFYCDTDSVFVNARGYAKLRRKNCIDQNQLGMLKLEGSNSKCEFWGPKDYVFGSSVKLKGIRHDAIYLGDDEYMQNRFEGLVSILKRGGDPYVMIEWTNKLLSRSYTKGQVSKDGSVSDFVLNEFE